MPLRSRNVEPVWECECVCVFFVVVLLLCCVVVAFCCVFGAFVVFCYVLFVVRCVSCCCLFGKHKQQQNDDHTLTPNHKVKQNHKTATMKQATKRTCVSRQPLQSAECKETQHIHTCDCGVRVDVAVHRGSCCSGSRVCPFGECESRNTGAVGCLRRAHNKPHKVRNSKKQQT